VHGGDDAPGPRGELHGLEPGEGDAVARVKAIAELAKKHGFEVAGSGASSACDRRGDTPDKGKRETAPGRKKVKFQTR